MANVNPDGRVKSSSTEPNRDTRAVVIANDAQPPQVRRVGIAGPELPAGVTPWKSLREQLKEDLAPTERTAGIHFAMLAPTRGGKTTLATKGLIPIYREAEVPVLVIDSTGDPKLAEYGERLPRWGDMTELHRVAVDDLSLSSREKVHRALERAYKQGDILIYVDEIRHLTDKRYMGMQATMESLWLFGGKRGITIGGATQAPRFVPSALYDQSKAHFLFRIRDDRARKRVEEISGDTLSLRSVIPSLRKYHFAYVNPDGDVSVGLYQGSTTSPRK